MDYNDVNKAPKFEIKTSPPPIMKEPPEKRILACFGESPTLPWKTFLTNAVVSFGTDKEQINHLKYSITDLSENVHKSTFEHFLRWYSPIKESFLNYQTGAIESDVPAAHQYTIDDVANIVRYPWFLGYLSAAKAKEILLDKPVGTFLVRFSSTIGSYTISVKFGQVGHWRISTEIKNNKVVYSIDERQYKSLEEIVDLHRKDPLVVLVDQSDCILTQGIDRDIDFPTTLFDLSFLPFLATMVTQIFSCNSYKMLLTFLDRLLF